MNKILFLLIFSVVLMADEYIHSSAKIYYENFDFSNSVQKYDGQLIGVGGDIHVDNSEFKFAYEHAKTDTKQPPLSENLSVDKMFLKYRYSFENGVSFNLNYINILQDNIAVTTHGKSYGLGLGYKINKRISANFTQFYTDYKDFDVYQSDLKLDYRTKISDIKMKLTSITHYINLDDYKTNSFSKNAKSDYLTTVLKVHVDYSSYHLGLGAYLGKRVFSIVDNGFKIQHHAMEFERTYVAGIGKSISNMVFKIQYIYQRATELPAQNENVEVRNIRLIANYKF